MAQVHIDIPAPVSSCITIIEIEVYTGILHITEIDIRLVRLTRQSRIRSLDQHIRGLLWVPFQTGTELTIQEGGIQTDIIHLCRLPFRILISITLQTETRSRRIVSTSDIIVCFSRIRWIFIRIISLTIHLGVSCLSITHTQFQVIQPIPRVIHEWLLGYTPAQRYGREYTITIWFWKTRYTITTHNACNQIFVRKWIVYTTKHTKQGKLSLILRLRNTTSVILTHIQDPCIHIILVKVIISSTCHLTAQTVANSLRTQQNSQFMDIIERGIVSQRIRPHPAIVEATLLFQVIITRSLWKLKVLLLHAIRIIIGIIYTKISTECQTSV